MLSPFFFSGIANNDNWLRELMVGAGHYHIGNDFAALAFFGAKARHKAKVLLHTVCHLFGRFHFDRHLGIGNRE